MAGPSLAPRTEMARGPGPGAQPGFFAASILLAIAAISTPAAAVERFFAPEPYRPYAMGGTGPCAAADLDADTRPDLVQANTNGTVAVRLNLGASDFAPPVLYPVGVVPAAIAAGDVTGDGIPDVVASRDFFVSGTRFGELVVLTGAGDGTLGPGPVLPTGVVPQAVVIADVDGDGRNDLIAMNTQDDDLTLYRSIPGGFAARVDIPTGDYPIHVAVARLDGDAAPDLAVACYFGGTVAVHLGLGGGAFGPMSAIPLGNNPGSIAAADMDGDTDLDLVVGNVVTNACCAGSCSILRGNGDGTFAAPTHHGSGAGTDAVAVADVDADALPDILALATISSRNGVSVLRGADGWNTAGLHFPTGPSQSSLQLADLSGDGVLDCLVGGGQPYAIVLEGKPNGPFETWTHFAFGLVRPSTVALADFNGDSRLDVFANDRFGNGYGVRLQQPDGTIGPLISDPAQINRARTGDLDGDDDQDLAGLGGFGGVTTRLGNGDGSFSAGPSLTTAEWANAVAIGDLDDDGSQDLVVACGGGITTFSGEVSVLMGTGGGGFAPYVTAAPGIWDAPLVLVDLDLDGNLDMVGSRSRRGQVLLGGGDGSFADGASLPGAFVPAVYAVGHLNADAFPDLVAGGVDGQGTRIGLFLGDGGGGFGTISYLAVPEPVVDLSVADVDGDGFEDLIWLGGGTVHVALGMGAAQFLPAVAYGSGGAAGLAIGDLNGDVSPDIALGTNEHQGVALLYNEHPGYPTAVELSLVRSEALPDRVRLAWHGLGASGLDARVERRTQETAWIGLGAPVADGPDLLGFEDRGVEPGRRYGYRLVVRSGDVEEPTSEVWLDIPAASAFALHGARPQPAGPDLRVAFSLAAGGGEAFLELLDVSGRRIDRRAVGGRGAGPHVVPLAEGRRLPPGLYLIRLVQGAQAATARAVVAR